MDGVAALVPYRPDGAWRDAAWRTIRPRWEAIGVELVVESPGPGESPAEFNHPLAINRARRRTSAEVVIVADADTGWDDGLVERLVSIVRSGDAAWALPSEYWQLSALQTRRLQVGGVAPDVEDVGHADWVGFGNAWSGLVAVAVEAFDEVGGYDERFAWWGADDGAFAVTMGTLVGPAARVPGRCLHHWHPRPDEMHGRQGYQHGLTRLYQEASGDPAAVRLVRFGS